MSLRLTSYVVALKPPKGVLKETQNGRFPCKIALHLKKVCYKVSLCENSQRQKCKAFIDLCIPVEMIGRGGRPIVGKNLAEAHPPLANGRYSVCFRL